MVIIATLVHWILSIISIVVLVDVVLSYFMSPFHPLRMNLDRIVAPMLLPIRRMLPQTGRIDFSPLVLIIVLQILDMFLQKLLL